MTTLHGGIAELESALLTYAADSLDACDLTPPDEADRFRYHGDPPVACCAGNGLLLIHWVRPRLDTTGIDREINAPVGRPIIDLYLRLFRCFPVLANDGSFDGPAADAAAAGLAYDEDCLFSAFTDAICRDAFAAYLSGCDQLRLVDSGPRAPRGGCAGIEFHFTAGWRAWDGS